MFQILAKARALEKQGKKIIHFELGDPDFSSPNEAVEGVVNSLNRGETHYTVSNGIPELRQEVAKTIQERDGFIPDLDQILITPGANIQIYYAIACTTNPGEEVIVPDPSFVSYFSIMDLLNVQAVRVPLHEENQFRLNPKDVEAAITDKTRLIILNSPSNPTGSVMTPQEIQEIYEIAKRHDIFVLTDEVYRGLVYNDEQEFVSPVKFDECKERTILVDGFSKRYAMTGWRMGFMVGPKELIRKMTLLLETLNSCVPVFLQKACIEVLKNSNSKTHEMHNEFQKRRDLLVNGLNTLSGVSCINPKGAFYAFANIKETGMSSREFSNFMLENAGVALAPGDLFGNHGSGYVRFSYTCSLEDIQEAINRMQSALENRQRQN